MRSLSLRAFIIAIVIHLAIACMIWMGSNWREKRDHKHYIEPKFIISFQASSLQKPKLQMLQSLPASPSSVKDYKEGKPKSIVSIEKKTAVNSSEEKSAEAVELLSPSDRVQRLIDRHYGELFEELSPAEKQYIIANIVTIHRIDRKVGNSLLADKPRDMFEDGESNFVEMYLYPDGTVSDITIISEEKNKDLDELTMETVERSYSKYPHPNQKTLIRLHTRIFKSKQ